jgi:DNA-binding NtrC family response regulator
LIYRPNVFPIPLPPLRNREGDVSLVVHFLAARYAARVGVRIASVGKATLERLSRYSWPGNFRELENGPALDIAPEVFTSALARAVNAGQPTRLVPKGQGRRQQALDRHGRSKAWNLARETTFWPLLKSPVGSLMARAALRKSWTSTPICSAAE